MRDDKPTSPTLWVDITELFGQFAQARHPTGISRVIMNLCDALSAEHGDLFARVSPIFWHPVLRMPLAVDGAEIGPLQAFFPALQGKYASSGWMMPAMRSGIRKGIITAIPKPFRFRLFPYLHGVTHFVGWARQAGLRTTPIDMAPNDCLFVPGSFWLDGYAPKLGALARSKGAAVVGFVHDVLLLSDPASMAPHHGRQFRRGLEAFLPYCTAIVCNSMYTRAQLQKYCPQTRDIPVAVCRLADSPNEQKDTRAPAEVARLLGERYVLLVSTLLPRKNHRLAVAAWQKLWLELGDQTPWLVMVGGGAPNAALADLLARGDSFGSRVIRVGGVDDAVLETLYSHAWLTVYPSLDEGYGMPVAEALARGKVCLAPNRGGMAEVAPNLVDSIDADDPDDLAKRVAGYLTDPALLRAREELIRTRYRPTIWADTARTVRHILENAVTALREHSRAAPERPDGG